MCTVPFIKVTTNITLGSAGKLANFAALVFDSGARQKHNKQNCQ